MTTETFLEMAQRHRAADTLEAGRFHMVGGKACSVGCICADLGLEPDDFAGLAEWTGYPESAHRLQEAIFEGLPEKDRADWHVQFAEKAATVTDWQAVIDATVLAALRIAKPRDPKGVVENVIALYERRANGDEPTKDEWDAAEEAAAEAAWAAAEEAAWAAEEAAWAAAEAARAAARDAAWAADAAEEAAWAADAAGDVAWLTIRDAFLNA